MIPNYNKSNFKKDPFILSLKINKNNSIYLELSHRMTDASYYKITYEGFVSKIDFKKFKKVSTASS